MLFNEGPVPVGTYQVVEEGSDIWVYDRSRDIAARLPSPGVIEFFDPLWSPDGQRIVYAAARAMRKCHMGFVAREKRPDL